jgi:glutathione peroxidase
LTPRHYKELVALHNDLSPQGLRILGFPCNQFGQQEPGSAEEIRAFAGRYGVEFDLFAKCDVNGPNAHPVFLFVRSKLSDILGSSVKWNWTKFLVDRNGTPVKRFAPPTIDSLRPAIMNLLAQEAGQPAAASEDSEGPTEAIERL